MHHYIDDWLLWAPDRHNSRKIMAGLLSDSALACPRSITMSDLGPGDYQYPSGGVAGIDAVHRGQYLH